MGRGLIRSSYPRSVQREVGFFFLSLRHRLVVLRLEDGRLLQRRKLLDLVDEVGSDALTTGADALDESKFLDIDLGRAQLTALLLTPDEEGVG